MSEADWCSQVAIALNVPEVEGLRAVLAISEGDRLRAWRFSVTLSKIGLCPVCAARAVLRGIGLDKSDAAQGVPTMKEAA